MHLRKKITFSFFISAFIIAILAVFEYINVIQVKNEIHLLEVTDTIRSKSLQLRRHEKNFFLYPEKAADESDAIYDYLSQIEAKAGSQRTGAFIPLLRLTDEYRKRFVTIETLLSDVSTEFGKLDVSLVPHERFVQLIEANIRYRPLYVSDLLTRIYSLPPDHPLIEMLVELNTRIDLLRETGEEIILSSKNIDRDARDKAEHGIRISQTAILILFPVFLISGIGILFYISSDVTRRLKTLTDTIDKIGNRYISDNQSQQEKGGTKDEVDALIDKFNRMDMQLVRWEGELHQKNKELLQSKKLAAIGTISAGVAHELNNPLNNIGISAQVLKRTLSEEASPEIMKIIEDIAGQTTRVRGIVADLLELARNQEPQLKNVELIGIIKDAFRLVDKSVDTRGITFAIETYEEKVFLKGNLKHFERVFINLFTNAISAMEGKGKLTVKVTPGDDHLMISVSDTGKGISEEDIERVFDPFFTKNEKGTGLGLAITLNIIKKHGGSISVKSKEGAGTTFEIKLPGGL